MKIDEIAQISLKIAQISPKIAQISPKLPFFTPFFAIFPIKIPIFPIKIPIFPPRYAIAFNNPYGTKIVTGSFDKVRFISKNRDFGAKNGEK
jgi:hypothetical protein